MFENGPAVASGVAAALRDQGRDHTKVIAIGGDGSTFDIGFGSLSGMLERGDDVLYLCTDNASYGNTGGQRSGATPLRAATTTHPAPPQNDATAGVSESRRTRSSPAAKFPTPGRLRRIGR